MEHLSKDFAKINPVKQVPAMKDGDFCLAEGHAIMKYLHETRKCADHWYPSDIKKRSKVDAYLDWHHSFLRNGAAPSVFKTVFAPMFKLTFSKEEIEAHRKVLDRSLKAMDRVFLANSPYLCGQDVTIADLSSFCEIMQLGYINEDISKYKNLTAWYERIYQLEEVQKVCGFIIKAIEKYNHKKAKL